MMRQIVLLGIAALAGSNAQSLALNVVSSSGTLSPVSQVYGFGQVAPGNTLSIHFRVQNSTTSAISLATLSLTAPSGSAPQGFALVNAPTLPSSIAANGTVDFNVTFSNATPGNYSSTLTVNSTSVILLATSLATAVVTVAAPCTGPGSTGTITIAGASCTVTLTNPTAQAFPVSPVTLTGAGFSGLPSTYVNGVTIPASQSVSFTLSYSGTGSSPGTLVVGLNSYTLSAAAASTSGALSITSVASDGSGTTTPVGATFDFSQVAAGDTKTVSFRAYNNGSTSIPLTVLCVEPTGSSCPVTSSNYFSIVNSQSPGNYAIAPGSFMTFQVRFSAAVVNTYTAALLVNSLQVNLTASAVPAASLSVTSPCTGPDSTNTISFGRIAQNGTVVCAFTLKNPNTQDLIVPVALTGTAFAGLLSSSITVPASQSISINLTFTATSAAVLTGTFVAGPRTYTLSGTGYSAPFPAPTLTFDTKTFNSGEHHALTISLPTPATVSTTGTLTLAFTPQATGITDDSAVMFVATGSRVANYSITAGSVAVTLNGQPNITFSTGTTAGTITFSMTAGIYGFAGDPTTKLTLAPMPISISSATASENTGDLIVSVTAFDNTYTAGPMTFTFYDTSGLPIGQPVTADFTSNFVSLYQKDTAGSAFLMGVYFPVTGDITKVKSVDVALKNSAGTTKTSGLLFP